MSRTEKTRITVNIYGREYVIVGTESASHIRHVASLVDEKMREIHSKNPSLDTKQLAVLTAINAVNDYVKIKDDLNSSKTKLNK